jgi:hypothetical protein
MMGKTSDAVKEGLGDAAEQTWEKGKAVASEAADQIWEEATGGLTSGTGAHGDYSVAQTASNANRWTDSQPNLVPEPDSAAKHIDDLADPTVLPRE